MQRSDVQELPDMEELIDAHASALYSLAWIMLVDRADAEAAVEQLWPDPADRRRFPSSTDTRRALSRDLYYVCTRSRRDSRTRRDQAVGPSTLVGRKDATAASLATLSEQERSAIALCLHGDHSYLEVAKLMALPPPVVLSLLRSGLRGLQP